MRKLTLAAVICIIILAVCIIPFGLPASAAEGRNRLVTITYENRMLLGSGYSYTYRLEFSPSFAALNAGAIASLASYFAAFGWNSEYKNFTLTANLRFSSLTDLYIANGITGYEKDDSPRDKKETFLYVSYTSEYRTVFSELSKPAPEDETKTTIIRFVFDYLLGLGITVEEMDFVYIYGTPYKTVSSNADERLVIDGGYNYSHVFHVKDLDMTVRLVQRSPNSKGWYLIAVTLALGVGAVPITISIVKRKKKEKMTNGSEPK